MTYNDIDKKLLEYMQQFAVHFYGTDKIPVTFGIPLMGVGQNIFQFNMKTGEWIFPLTGLTGKGIIELCSIIMGISQAEAAQKLSALLERQA